MEEDRPEESGEAPASPPLPQRHTAVTPGPRASRLHEVHAQALRHMLGKVGWENFAGCFPVASKRAEGVLKQVQGQMVEKLGEKCEVRESFVLILHHLQALPNHHPKKKSAVG